MHKLKVGFGIAITLIGVYFLWEEVSPFVIPYSAKSCPNCLVYDFPIIHYPVTEWMKFILPLSIGIWFVIRGIMRRSILPFSKEYKLQ